MKNIKALTFILSLFIFIPNSLANDESSPVSDCSLTVREPKPVLKNLYDVSMKFAKSTCETMKEDDVRAINDMDFLTGGLAEGARQEAINFYASSFPEDLFPTVKGAKFMWSGYTFPESLRMDTYELTLGYQAGSRYGFSGPQLAKMPEIKISEDMSKHCELQGFNSCKSFFKEIERVGRIQNHFIRKDYSDEALAGIRAKSTAWDKFSDDSRFQTSIDILFTSWIYSEELSDGKNLNFPPENQYFLLHPSLVLDHYTGAKAGSKDELGLAIEWAGFNRWDAKIPWGISLASVYSDRAEGDSVGHGVMIHLYNNFSFGIANRGSSDNSFYINLELMNWFGEKQEKYELYKKSVGF